MRGAGGVLTKALILRTAKSCVLTPDAGVKFSRSKLLASFLGATVANKPGHRGERGRKLLKPLRGNAGCFRCDRGD